MQEPNYIKNSVLATFGLILCLGVLYAVPEFDLGSFHYRRVNILSDIMEKKAAPAQPQYALRSDSTFIEIKPPHDDRCKPGITCIEDYSPDSSGMQAYLTALDSADQQVVRIAYFADSYVEGDIMLQPLRDTLQQVYGGNGVGFVPITSEVAGFRISIIHKFDNWTTYSMVGDRSNEHPLGPAGFSFVPKEENQVSYKASRYRHLTTLPTAQLFYRQCAGPCAVVKNETDTIGLTGDKPVNVINLAKNAPSLKLSFIADSMDLYGISFEDTRGISVDNFSMRGNSGTALNAVSEGMYRSFDAVHPYRLIFLAYGLNVASEKQTDYSSYGKSMTRVVERMKSAFPNSSIVLVGCSDRGANVDGDYMTMENVKLLIREQRKVAAKNGICFWDMFQAMGGDSTMVRWVNEKPPLANNDYTHLTFRGGHRIAELLAGTLLYEKEKYDRRKKLTKKKLVAVHQVKVAS
ncbi:MAG: hypothetical protein JST83_03520 [Bacteroidetes bacterium]|nr:hypothetical protein [Bacteroidota bacterium]